MPARGSKFFDPLGFIVATLDIFGVSGITSAVKTAKFGEVMHTA